MRNEILTIKNNVRLSDDVYVMTFLKSDASYKAGQFVELKVDGFTLRRPFGVYDCFGGELSLLYKVVGGGTAFGTDPKIAESLVKEVKKVAKKPIMVKLSPNVTSITEMAKAVEGAGADGISLINTLVGMRIDLQSRQPILNVKSGGYSGRGVFPIAVKMVYDVYRAVDIPIVGMGGITNAKEEVEMMMAGATAVMVGTENLINPYASKEIIDDLPNVLKQLNVSDINEIIGSAK